MVLGWTVSQCSCLIVGWPVGLSSPTLGVGRPSVMFLFDCWPVGRPMLRTVRWTIWITGLRPYRPDYWYYVFPRPRTSGFKETPYSLDREDSERRDHGLWLSDYTTGDRILPIERRNTMSPGPRFPLLEARSWQEAKSNLVTVALGKDDRIAWCWTLGSPVVSERGFVHASGTHDLIGFQKALGKPVTSSLGFIVLGIRIEIVESRIARLLGDENLKVEGVRGQTQTRSERGETDSENWAVVWTGQMGRNKTLLGKDFISIWEMRDRGNGWSNQRRRLARSYHGKLVGQQKEDAVIIQVKIYEDDCGDIGKDTQGTVKGRVKRYEDDYGDFRQYTQRDMGKQSKEL
ncbi:hypothetical protein YC2023_108424 [Brassica napus]